MAAWRPREPVPTVAPGCSSFYLTWTSQNQGGIEPQGVPRHSKGQVTAQACHSEGAFFATEEPALTKEGVSRPPVGDSSPLEKHQRLLRNFPSPLPSPQRGEGG